MWVAVAPSGAEGCPASTIRRTSSPLAADPPRWPERTGAVSLLALDLDVAREGLASVLPQRGLRLEFLDYPGEWLLDLPLLGQDFAEWSRATLRRLETPEAAPLSRDFLAFVRGLAASAPAEETLAATGHRLYRAALVPASGRSWLVLSAAGPLSHAGARAGAAVHGLFPADRQRCVSPGCSRPGSTPIGRRLRGIWFHRCSARWTGWWCWPTCCPPCTPGRRASATWPPLCPGLPRRCAGGAPGSTRYRFCATCRSPPG